MWSPGLGPGHSQQILRAESVPCSTGHVCLSSVTTTVLATPLWSPGRVETPLPTRLYCDSRETGPKAGPFGGLFYAKRKVPQGLLSQDRRTGSGWDSERQGLLFAEFTEQLRCISLVVMSEQFLFTLSLHALPFRITECSQVLVTYSKMRPEHLLCAR